VTRDTASPPRGVPMLAGGVGQPRALPPVVTYQVSHKDAAADFEPLRSWGHARAPGAAKVCIRRRRRGDGAPALSVKSLTGSPSFRRGRCFLSILTSRAICCKFRLSTD
ncbi:unnamed protein product, partial [Prorocentrum cordatum]